MGVLTLEGVIKQGQIRLTPSVRLPENAKVYVIVIPEVHVEQKAHIFSPHLAHPEQASDFVLEITEEPSNANV